MIDEAEFVWPVDKSWSERRQRVKEAILKAYPFIKESEIKDVYLIRHSDCYTEDIGVQTNIQFGIIYC